uniref:FBA_2 domain-containing protein n=1 Tax=Caenorhabditis tropicalis TaxID=1561998 RepID=A0A1I7ULL0_9PELO
MASSEGGDDTVKEIARRWIEMQELVPISTADRLLEKRCHLKHVAWKFTEHFNELWIDGVLGVVITANQPSPTGELQTKVHYEVDLEPQQTRATFHSVDIADLARWHLAWLTDPNVWIDSASIDMEFDQKYLVEKRKFQVKEVNINVQTNYPSVHGWLQHMHSEVESLIYRGNGIMDANKFLQLPFAARLRKLLIIYESSFDDRLILQLTAEHLQIASDFLSEHGVNKLLHRWNDLNYPIRSEFVIYVPVKNSENVIKQLRVIEKRNNGNGVYEFLIEMTNPNARMRVITRPSSVTCTVFAIDNSQAPPPLSIPTVPEDKK